MAKVKAKYFKPKQKPAGILLNVKALMYFKFKLYVKFKNNKNYTSRIANSHIGLRQKKR
jgi:hypothetical protein